jgi:hypothetical protein
MNSKNETKVIDKSIRTVGEKGEWLQVSPFRTFKVFNQAGREKGELAKYPEQTHNGITVRIYNGSQSPRFVEQCPKVLKADGTIDKENPGTKPWVVVANGKPYFFHSSRDAGKAYRHPELLRK